MQFRKKPVVIEAVQWTGSNVDEIARFMLPYPRFQCIEPDKLVIPTLEGDHTANAGDWIIKGIANEFYPIKPDIFAATYEPVE